jgi:fructose 1,6-bisphosphate aldolase/phosphatase
MGRNITLTVIKADVGGFVGHSSVHPELLETARGMLTGSPLLIDFYVTHVGDDINLIMTHETGKDNGEIHQLAWDTFASCTRVPRS